ncbi:MAG: hypothetical protein E7370_04330 [Clostridiales bacterium]|nr:hypothetical protein [Clostridiales bacterium]
MTFHDWIFSIYPDGSNIDGAWGPLHIITLVLVIGVIVGLSFLKNKSEKVKRGTIIAISALIFVFEISRRIIGFSRDIEFESYIILRTLLPRPWCAISCWCMIIAPIVNKRFFYNYTAIIGILCTLVFFAYPSVGFNHKYILFEDLYSISTHSLLLTGSISLITLRFTDFKYKGIWKECICLAVTFAYAFIEIFVLKIDLDPLYFMPDNEVQEILGTSYPLYLVIYISFLTVFFNAYYLIKGLIDKRKHKA